MRKYCLWRRFLQFWVCADWSRKLQTCLSYSLYNDVLCLSVFMHDLKFSFSVLLKLCVRICSLCTMAEERTVSRCLMVRVEISEMSLADLKQFVTEKGLTVSVCNDNRCVLAGISRVEFILAYLCLNGVILRQTCQWSLQWQHQLHPMFHVAWRWSKIPKTHSQAIWVKLKEFLESQEQQQELMEMKRSQNCLL